MRNGFGTYSNTNARTPSPLPRLALSWKRTSSPNWKKPAALAVALTAMARPAAVKPWLADFRKRWRSASACRVGRPPDPSCSPLLATGKKFVPGAAKHGAQTRQVADANHLRGLHTAKQQRILQS